MCFHIRPEHGVHARKMALALLPEPGQDIRINPQVNGRLTYVAQGSSHWTPRPEMIG